MTRMFLAMLAAAGVACESPSESPAPVATETATANASATASAPSPSLASAPAVELDALDGRTAVPLLPMMAHHQKQNMRDHLLAVQEIVDGLAKEDFAAVERAARRIGSSDEMKRMCNHMGAGAAGFTPRALEFHETADTIASAAQKKDAAGTLAALSATLGRCNGCHATFKQQVVGAADWERATGARPPAHGMPH